MAALATFASSLATGAESAPEDAVFTYAGPAGVDGRFVGSCVAFGFEIETGHRTMLTIQHRGAVLVWRTTYVNVTRVHDDGGESISVVLDAHTVERRTFIESGNLSVAGPRITGLRSQYLEGARDPFRAEWQGQSLRLHAPSTELVAPEESYVKATAEGDAGFHHLDYGGTARRTSADAAARITGDVTLYLRGSHIEAGAHEMQQPAYRHERPLAGGGALEMTTIRFTDAFVELRDASTWLPPAAEIVCGAIEAHVVGTVNAAQASGALTAGEERLEFDQRVLSLTGSFAWQDEPSQPPGANSDAVARVHASGSFATSIDFTPASVTGGDGWAPELAVGAAIGLVGLALMLFQVWGHFVGAFYSRIAPDRALENRTRDALYDAVVQRPGIDLTALGRVTNKHLTTVVYHVRVLRRARLVKTMRLGRTVCVLPLTRLRAPSQTDLALERHRELRYIRETVAPRPLRLSTLARETADRFRISKRAAYHWIQQAADSNIVTRRGRRGHEEVSCNNTS